MKRLICILLTLIMIFALSACGEKDDSNQETINIDIHSILSKSMELVNDEEPQSMDLDQLTSIYGIEKDWVKDYACAYTMSGVFPGEIIMIEANDDASRTSIKEKLELRLSDVLEQSKNYDEANFKIAQTCKVIEKGNFIALFISDKHVEMEELFSK